VEKQLLALYVATDALMFMAAICLASLARLDTLHQVSFTLLMRDRAVCVLVFTVAVLLAGVPGATRSTDRFDSVFYTLLALGGTALALLVLTALLPPEARAISRRELLLGVLIAAPLTGSWHYAIAPLLARLEPFRRFFYVLGSDEESGRIAEAINGDASVIARADQVSPSEFLERAGAKGVATGPGHVPNRDAIISLSEADRDRMIPLLEMCGEHCRRTYIHPSLHDTLLLGHARLFQVAGVPLLQAGVQPAGTYLHVKRWLDGAVALALLALASPVCLAAALVVRLTSSGPVLYSQERMGQYGRIFRLYKFRSMVIDAESSTGPVWATAADRRVTPVGRFLRKHRIDEIPQLFNVLRGDMSLVGPRPERPHFHEEFRQKWPLFDQRLTVRPGVTSLSHVLGGYASDPGDRLRYDLIYIGSLSLLTDLRILLATIRVVLGGKGAQ
jgi:exopolysaccharide biosynthesis polyprenyl glycosylphosphotransferase